MLLSRVNRYIFSSWVLLEKALTYFKMMIIVHENIKKIKHNKKPN